MLGRIASEIALLVSTTSRVRYSTLGAHPSLDLTLILHALGPQPIARRVVLLYQIQDNRSALPERQIAVAVVYDRRYSPVGIDFLIFGGLHAVSAGAKLELDKAVGQG